MARQLVGRVMAASPTPSLDKIAYTPDEVVALTPFSRIDVMAAIHRGDLHAKKHGRRYIIPQGAVEAWLDGMADA